MIKCPSCGEMNPDQNSKCSHCGELLLMTAPPRKDFPTAALILLEVLAFMVFVFAMYVFRAGGNAWLSFLFAGSLAVLTPFGCIHVYQKRKEHYEVYITQLNAKSEDTSFEEMKSALQGTGDSSPALAYYMDLEKLEQRMRRRSYVQSGEESITWQELVDRFCAYVASCGLDIPRQESIGLLTAMATSRLIRLRVVPSENTAYVFELMKCFFGVDYHTTCVHPQWKTTYDLLGQNTVEAGTTAATGILLDMYAARYTENSVCFTVLEQVDPTRENEYLYDILPYVRNPAMNRRILFRKGNNAVDLEFVDDREFLLPKNMWYFCVPSVKSDLTIPSPRREEILAGFERAQALCLHVAPAGSSEPEISAPPFQPVRYDKLLSMVSDVYDHVLLSEAQWRKWDEFKCFSREKLALRIHNRDEVIMENISSLYAASSPDAVTEEMALDFALRHHVLPRVISDVDPSELREDELEQALEAIFGENTVPRFAEGLHAWKRMHETPLANETNQEGNG